MLLVIMCVIMVIGATENKNEKELTKMKNEKIKEMMRAMVSCLLKENESFKNTAATITMMTATLTTKTTTPILRRRLLLVKKNEKTTTATTNDEKTIFRMMIKNGGDEEKKTGTERKKGGDGEKKEEETLLRREGNAWPALLTQIRSINIFDLHHHHLWRTT